MTWKKKGAICKDKGDQQEWAEGMREGSGEGRRIKTKPGETSMCEIARMEPSLCVLRLKIKKNFIYSFVCLII